MLSNVIVALAKTVGFLVTVVCAIVSFYAAIHTINVNTQIDVFIGGLLALLMGVVAGPLYCLVAFHGLSHYLAFTSLGAGLILVPVLLAWCVFAYTVASGYLKG